METKKIKGFRSYYVTKDGRLFKVYGGKEITIPIIVKKSVPFVKIGNSNYNFVFIMLEYFGNEKILRHDSPQYKYQYKIIDGKLSFDSIKLKKYNEVKFEDIRIFQWKCVEKSRSANSRVHNISTITEYDVLNSLLRTDFNCTYCNRKLFYKTWELDHISPLSVNGFNTPTNITPSCKMCNRMKSNMELVDFIHTCAKIVHNYKDSDILSEKTFIPNKQS